MGVDDKPAEIAQQAAQLGIRTKYMRSEQLELHARLKYGRITLKQSEEYRARLKILDAADPLLPNKVDSKMPLVEKMIMLLRGTNIFLGVLGKHNAQSVWINYARALLMERGAEFPEKRLQLDLGAPSHSPQQGRQDLEPKSGVFERMVDRV